MIHWSALAASTALLACAPAAHAAAAPSTAPAATDGKTGDLLKRIASDAVVRLGRQADAQSGPGASQAAEDRALFLIGLSRLLRQSELPEGRAFLDSSAERNNFALPGASSPAQMVAAGNLAIGSIYQDLYARGGNPAEIEPLRARLDYIGQFLGVEPEPARLVWWRPQDLFDAAPVFARAAHQENSHSFLKVMDDGWWRTHKRLWLKQDSLYRRDEKAGVADARGNGAAFAALARVLEVMPATFPSRPLYVAQFKAMAQSLAARQGGTGGLWSADLAPSTAKADIAASGLIAYGMAFGINHGLLERDAYLPHIRQGWTALAARAGASGPVSNAETGAILLAGAEVAVLDQAQSALPMAEARPATPPARVGLAADNLGFDPAQTAAPAGRADAQTGIVMPRVTLPLTPPPADQRGPRASVAFAPYRFDDLLWENDRTAHRIYGPALQHEEPPSGSGIDAWGKNVPWPFMERQLKTGKQHDYHGDGIDFYNVGGTRGAGGLGIWYDDKLWVSRNFKTYRIIKNGPDVAEFEVTYAPWPVDVDRKVWETRRFALPVGTNFTRMTSTIGSDKPGGMQVAIGIQKKATSSVAGQVTADRARGRFSWWSPTDPEKGATGVAIMVDPAMIEDVREDAENLLILLKVSPGKPFVYYMGATWDKSRDFHDRGAWDGYVMRQTPDFDPQR